MSEGGEREEKELKTLSTNICIDIQIFSFRQLKNEDGVDPKRNAW